MALTGKTDEEKIYNFLMRKIKNSYGVAGLMGNLYAESGLKPTNLQNSYETKLGFTDDTYTTSVDNGDYTNFVHDSAGYGLAQWTYYSRKQSLLDYVTSKNKSIGDLETQLEFLCKELSENYKAVFSVLKSATSVKAASDSVLTQYERPADQSDNVKTKRAGYGQNFYDSYAVQSSKGGNSAMGKTIQTGYITDSINGISVNSSLKCNAGNYNNNASREVAFVVMHYTGNSKDTARANANYFTGAGRNASAHIFVDDTEIWQSVELRDTAWHCGASSYKHNSCRNANSIGIEMCCTAGNYKISDTTKKNAAYVCAYICKLLGITASGVDTYVLRHYDVTGKQCPAQMAGSGNAEWTAFKNMVKEILGGTSSGTAASSGQMYRVRKTWADTASQKGAFTSLDNAKKCADENSGYSVFDSSGNKVYPAESASSSSGGTACNYLVKILVDDLNYRNAPGTTGTKVLGQLQKNYKYTVVEERTVDGVKWGKLKSGAGWFSLHSKYSVKC